MKVQEKSRTPGPPPRFTIKGDEGATDSPLFEIAIIILILSIIAGLCLGWIP